MADIFQLVIEKSNTNIKVDKVIESYKKNYEKYSPVNQKMVDLIDKLRTKFKIYALSNTNLIHKEVNEKRGLFKHFDKSFLSCEIGIRKPNKEIYQIILDQIKVDPKELVFIDDNKENIKTANTL